MRSSIKDMTTGKPLPLIVSFALPLMVGNIFQQLYTVVDAQVVGTVEGVGALAALGASDWFYWMFLGLVQGLAQGFCFRSGKIQQGVVQIKEDDFQHHALLSACSGPVYRFFRGLASRLVFGILLS